MKNLLKIILFCLLFKMLLFNASAYIVDNNNRTYHSDRIIYKGDTMNLFENILLKNFLSKDNDIYYLKFPYNLLQELFEKRYYKNFFSHLFCHGFHLWLQILQSLRQLLSATPLDCYQYHLMTKY